MQRICIFCGSSPGARPGYVQEAEALGRAIVENNFGLVYGGASVGIMGAVADAVLKSGGEVIGVIPKALTEKEISHTGLTEMRVVESMHERKALMADLSDGFIAMPGGLGTIEELFEILTWAQLGIHQKPCGLLNVEHYFDQLLAFLDRTVTEKFVQSAHRSMLLVDEDPVDLLQKFKDYQPPVVDKAAWALRQNNS